MSRPNRDLCIMACVFCRDPLFHKWMRQQPVGLHIVASQRITNEDAAKEFILQTCGVTSRNHLDHRPAAAALFHKHVREPFLAWKEAR